jgi:hypothetical protein
MKFINFNNKKILFIINLDKLYNNSIMKKNYFLNNVYNQLVEQL